ncbi:hypothetical protein LFL96_25770 [Paraburkholderia sp. D15]|uniref:hypothetical protein n=1 Tax=Paraburkholderia sp. D15 TaxID=2880218 RepID=UPI00247B0390|nr:hypothetical protein [Paraburkholderia sp. D15]WGS54424.1 hypothetical protein LFL96_25770 [Paraburkholderia sp. D15]
MKKYTGSLERLGTSRVLSGYTRYTYIEIGNDRLKNLSVSDALDGVLQEGLKTPASISIWVVSYMGRKIVAGVSRADGTVFRSKITGIPLAIVMALFAIACIWGGLSEKASFFVVLGLVQVAFLVYLGNLNRKVLTIPANDAL